MWLIDGAVHGVCAVRIHSHKKKPTRSAKKKRHSSHTLTQQNSNQPNEPRTWQSAQMKLKCKKGIEVFYNGRSKNYWALVVIGENEKS